jgi:hypothetical protein
MPKILRRHGWRPDELADYEDDLISLDEIGKGGQQPVPTVDGEKPEE